MDIAADSVAHAAIGVSRRRVLGLLATGAAVTSAGLLLPPGPADAVTEAVTEAVNVRQYSGVGGQRTYYEPTGARTKFYYNPTFHGQLGTWLQFWYLNTPASYLEPFHIYSYGCYVRNDGDDAHAYGRGFDLARIFVTDGGHIERKFTARTDTQWPKMTTAQRAVARRHYWATAASAHYYFRDVLTYLYNSAHRNHIHIDNTVTGTTSSYDTTSRAQTQHVQACLRYIWGKATTIDGVWGPQTRSDSTSVLRRIGRSSGTLTTKANWLAFNKATLRKGYGVQSY